MTIQNQDTTKKTTEIVQPSSVAKGSRSTEAEKSQAVEAEQFDPKEAKHGVDFCCGSCGG